MTDLPSLSGLRTTADPFMGDAGTRSRLTSFSSVHSWADDNFPRSFLEPGRLRLGAAETQTSATAVSTPPLPGHAGAAFEDVITCGVPPPLGDTDVSSTADPAAQRALGLQTGALLFEPPGTRYRDVLQISKSTVTPPHKKPPGHECIMFTTPILLSHRQYFQILGETGKYLLQHKLSLLGIHKQEEERIHDSHRAWWANIHVVLSRPLSPLEKMNLQLQVGEYIQQAVSRTEQITVGCGYFCDGREVPQGCERSALYDVLWGLVPLDVAVAANSPVAVTPRPWSELEAGEGSLSPEAIAISPPKARS